jgi:hypothetical protein
MQDNNCSLQVLWIRNAISMVSLKPILAKLRLHELNLNVFVPLYFMAQNFWSQDQINPQWNSNMFRSRCQDGSDLRLTKPIFACSSKLQYHTNRFNTMKMLKPLSSQSLEILILFHLVEERYSVKDSHRRRYVNHRRLRHVISCVSSTNLGEYNSFRNC